MQDLRDQLLAYLRSRAGKRIPYRRLAKALGLPASKRRPMAQALEQLIREGAVERVGGRLVRAAAPARPGGTLEGRLRVHRSAGFAFLVPEDPDAEDLYIGSRDFGEALDGDRVRAEFKRRSGRGPGPRGRVVAVLEHARTRLVGEVFGTPEQAFLLPDDPRLHRDFGIEDLGGATVGDVVVAEISDYPRPGFSPAVRVLAALGRPGDAGIEIDKTIAARELRAAFPADVLAEARTLADAGPAADAARRDLTAVPFVTIDPVDARDFDDAVALHEGRVLVAIADVSAFVPAGSAVDLEARLRGCSTYFPDRVLPMLPEPLTNAACSLRPEEDHAVMVADLPLPDAEGTPELYRATIRSVARLTYAEAQSLLDNPRQAGPFPGCAERLGDLARVAHQYNAARTGRGALDLDLPEAVITLDDAGQPVDVTRARRREAHRLVEGLMIAANEAVAEWFVARAAPALFRVHERPDPLKLRALTELARTRGLEPPRGDSPAALSEFLEQLRDRDDGLAVARVLLRSLARARYADQNLGHHGLASTAYLHFTSPIRRYPDLVVHRRLLSLLAGEAPAAEDLAALGLHCSDREHEAEGAEREVVDVYRTLLLSHRIGEQFTGQVCAVLGSGFFVEFDAPFVEGFVDFARLPGRWDLDPVAHAAVAGRRGERILLGDRVTVEVENVSVYRRRVECRLIEPDPGACRQPRPASRPRRRGRG